MICTDFKPIYAENNTEWRIRYHCNGLWELQEWCKLPDSVDRSMEQPWITHNRNMSYEDAIVALGRHNLKAKAA